jgi:hypothetical protein
LHFFAQNTQLNKKTIQKQVSNLLFFSAGANITPNPLVSKSQQSLRLSQEKTQEFHLPNRLRPLAQIRSPTPALKSKSPTGLSYD